MPLRSQFSSFRSLGSRYWLLFTAGVLSDVGSFNTQTALLLYLYRLSGHDARAMGATMVASLVPMVLASPLGGVWAEKLDRRWIMVVNDLIRAPLVLLMMTTENIALILTLQCAISASSAIFMPSRQAIIPELVKPDQVHLANTINGGVLSLVHVLGPILGALIFAATGSLKWIVILDASTYFLSAGLLGMMRYRRASAAPSGTPNMLREIYAGFRYVRGEKDFLSILTMLTTSGIAIGLLFPLLRPFIEEVLHGKDINYAHLIAAFGVGGFIGPLVNYKLGRRLGLGLTVCLTFSLESIFMLAWSRTSSIALSMGILFLWGVDVFTLIPCYMSYVHTYAKKEFMGRTFALFDQASFIPQILSAGVVALIGNRLPTQSILTATAVLYVLVVLLRIPLAGDRLLRSRRGEQASPPQAILPVAEPVGALAAEKEI